MASSLLHAFVDVTSSRYPLVEMHQVELTGSATRRPKRTPFVCTSSYEENREFASERTCESGCELIKAASMICLSLLASSTMQSSPTWANPIMPANLSIFNPVTTITAPSRSPTTTINCCLLPPTNEGGNIMPTMFTKKGTALYDAKRNYNHLPLVLNTLNRSNISSTTLTNDQFIQDGLNIMYQSVVITPSTPNLLMGQKYSAGDPEPNVGNLYSAARDNVDRLWTVWNTIGGRHQDHTDPDYLGATFLFYDENDGRLSFTTVSTNNIQEIGPATQTSSPVKVGKKLVRLVKRPTQIPQSLVDQGLDKDNVEEVLVLEDVQVPRNVATHIVVFINLPDADEKTPLSCVEYVGSFIREGMGMRSRNTNVRFGISDNIKRLGIKDLTTLPVTVVAKLGGTGITLKGIKIEYE